MLNGESMPSEKHTEVLQGDPVLADRKNMVYMGTSRLFWKRSRDSGLHRVCRQNSEKLLRACRTSNLNRLLCKRALLRLEIGCFLSSFFQFSYLLALACTKVWISSISFSLASQRLYPQSRRTARCFYNHLGSRDAPNGQNECHCP